jgi:hypothetical protein
MTALEHAPSVTPEYRHAEKLVSSETSLALDGTVLKWYEIAADDTPVPLAVRALARRNLRDSRRDGSLGVLGELGFVLLHRCGEDFYFLLVCTWRNENELWETVWAKNGAADVFFRPWAVDGPHRPTFCVWELGAVCHERRAWAEYLGSERDERARAAYLRSSYEGIA